MSKKIPGRISPSDAVRLSLTMAEVAEDDRRSFLWNGGHVTAETQELMSPIWTHSVSSLQDIPYLQHADTGLSRMIHAAALSAPEEPLKEMDLPSESGVCFFAEPIVVDYPDFSFPASAVSWTFLNARLESSTDAEPAAVIVVWSLEGNKIKTRVSVISQSTRKEGGIGPALVRSITAMNRSPLVGVRPENKRAPATRQGTPATRADPALRRSYLRKPEYGDMELAAARDKNYSPKRGHWVRGHWRKQWHPSTEEHIHILIHGHLRGDFKLGAVTGPKILIGKGDRP